MARVTGVGGLFWRAGDPGRLQEWYATLLGTGGSAHGLWQQDAGPTVVAAFSRDDEHFGLEQAFMVNLRVEDLPGLLDQLRGRGVEVLREDEQEGVGRFAWIADPEGNRVELWELVEE